MTRRTLLVGLLVGLLVFSSAGFAYADPARPLAPGARRGATIEGEVTAINGDALTVQTEHRGTLTVQTDEHTRFRAKGDPGFSFADIKIGDTIAANGRFTGESTLLARVVVLVPADVADAVTGKVTAVNGDEITIEENGDAVVTIITTADTTFRVNGKPGASIEDVQAGTLIAAAGQFDADGALIARHVVARQPRTYDGGPVAGGKVAEVNGGEIVVSYPDGSSLTITTDASTLVIKRGEGGPVLGSLGDVAVGARIVAMGVPSSDGNSLAAKVILIGAAQPAEPLQP
ncbi:MAG TPA: DUF5666 domain-containing protein [Anaerolineae bacterium]